MCIRDSGYYMQSYNLNMRRPLFQDIRVREALGYTCLLYTSRCV